MASLPNPKPLSSKPLMTLLFQTQNPKPKKKKKISCLSLLVCVCMCICFLSSFPIYDSFFSGLWFPLCVCVCVCVCFNFVDVKCGSFGYSWKGPFFGLKPNRSSFYFLIFLVWLPWKWGRRVFSSLKPTRKWANWRFARYRKKTEEGKRKKK